MRRSAGGSSAATGREDIESETCSRRETTTTRQRENWKVKTEGEHERERTTRERKMDAKKYYGCPIISADH